MLMTLKFFNENLKDSSLGDTRGILQRILVGSTMRSIKDLYRKTPNQDFQGLTKTTSIKLPFHSPLPQLNSVHFLSSYIVYLIINKKRR